MTSFAHIMPAIKWILILQMIFIAGCLRTVGAIEIEGKVVDEATKIPIAGRDIIVQGLITGNNGIKSMEAGQFSTDSSGSFKYKLNKIRDAYYYKFNIVGDSDYAFRISELGLMELNENAKFLNFSMNKLVGLTIKIYRKTKIPAYDTLYMGWKSDGIDGRILYPFKIFNNDLTASQELKWIGGNVKSTIKVRAFADKMATIRWALFRNGRSKEIIDTITCKRDRKNEVQLVY